MRGCAQRDNNDEDEPGPLPYYDRLRLLHGKLNCAVSQIRSYDDLCLFLVSLHYGGIDQYLTYHIGEDAH